MTFLMEQVDECLKKGTVTLADLIEPDGAGGFCMRADLEISKPLEKVLTGLLEMIEGQDQAIRLIATAVESG
jgi:hypothetical protein